MMAGVPGWGRNRAGGWRRGIRQCLLLVLFGLGILSSPAVSAALCSNVFPQDATPGASARLDLSVMEGKHYVAFPSNGTAYTSSRDFFYQSGKLANNKTISVTPGQPVRIFVDGDLEFAPHSEINPGGSAADLLIVVRGNLKIGTDNSINALLYVTGDAELNPGTYLQGALTAEGSIDNKAKNVLIYDDEAAEQFAYGDLCETAETSPLYLRFDEPSWGVPANTGGGSFDIRAVGGAATRGTDPALPINQWGEGTCRYGAFSGAGSRVVVADHDALDMVDVLSASLWVKPETTPANNVVLLAKGDTYRLELNSRRELILTSRVSGWFGGTELSVTSAPLSEGEWVHVGFNLKLTIIPWWADRLEGTLYINGSAQATASRSFIFGVLPVDTAPLTVGGASNAGLDGAVDEVRLARALWSVSEFQRQMAARHWCGNTAAIDHFEFVTSAGAHTCSPHTVTLKACTNVAPGECQLYPGDVSVSLTSDGWVGGSNKVLINGIGTFRLQGLQLEMPLGVAASSPLPGNQTLCQIGNAPLSAECTLSFSQSGFVFDVPNLLANRGAQNIPISAVVDLGTPGSPNCEPAFTDETRDVKFWSGFVSPAGSELTVSSEPVWVNGDAVSQGFAEAEALPLRFDNKGNAILEVNYREAGRMQLSALYAGSGDEDDSGLMIGSDDFVAIPAGFCITPEAICASGGSNCSAFRQVGQTFTATVRPVAWNDSDTICAGTTTRNYRQDNLTLEPVLVQPLGGVSGEVLEPTSRHYDHQPPGAAIGWNGEVIQNVAFSEVGVFRLGVTPPPLEYYGATVPSSVSAPVGRFYPTHLSVSGAGALAPRCGVFSYQDQPISFATPLALTITGYGKAGGEEYVTRNYDLDGFWGFTDRPVQTWRAQERDQDLSDRLVMEDAVIVVGANGADGARTYLWSADELAYARGAAPDEEDLPFSILQRYLAEALTDQDGICVEADGCQGFDLAIGGSQIRLGRLRISNAHGSELLSLELPWVIESWQAPGAFLPEAGDACSALVWGAADAVEKQGALAGEALSMTGGTSGYQGSLSVQAPGATGSARIGFPDVPEWLWYDWRGEGREASRGLATFGIYQGPKPLIFRREVYR